MTDHPRTDRPVMPAGYGLESANSYVDWADVEQRLVESANYWLSTTHPDGRPHAVPRWGVWVDTAFWYDGSPTTRHSRNLETNPFVVLHLESGTTVTIVEGTSTVPPPVHGPLGERLSAEFARKYGPEYTPPPDAWSGEDSGGMHVLRPSKVIAWTSFPSDLTRFTF